MVHRLALAEGNVSFFIGSLINHDTSNFGKDRGQDQDNLGDQFIEAMNRVLGSISTVSEVVLGVKGYMLEVTPKGKAVRAISMQLWQGYGLRHRMISL